jgi:dATP pyrophosphohydrolase
VTQRYKRPESVLVVVYAATGKVLLLKRADHPDFWQSVTGAMDWEEVDPRLTAARELREETGWQVAPEALHDLQQLRRFSIIAQWRARYAPSVAANTERAYAFGLAHEETPTLAPAEHTDYAWLPVDEAKARVASWTNRDAIDAVQKQLLQAKAWDSAKP